MRRTWTQLLIASLALYVEPLSGVQGVVSLNPTQKSFFSMEEGVVLGCVVCVCLDLVDETRPHQFQNTTYQVEMEPYAYCVARFIMPS